MFACLLEQVITSESMTRQPATAQLGCRTGNLESAVNVLRFERTADLLEVHPGTTPAPGSLLISVLLPRRASCSRLIECFADRQPRISSVDTKSMERWAD